ncbi:MAG: ATP phosphoribosyltransferase regulatory subunit [Clostridia bacterium]|nr:ATP phosphoribosyltransferase regulatory subunit [Clostridia bacterium]
MSEYILKEEERIGFELRILYNKYGYLPFKMSKFEGYDLYAENKEFLVGDGVIAFNDTDGKLLALKPDVTLSIIKNDLDESGKRKISYHENVYRISGKTKQFKEILQSGVECIGEIDVYDVYETVCLAAESLQTISPEFVLDLSNLSILSGVLEEIGKGDRFVKLIMACIAEKNVHETKRICEEFGVSKTDCDKLLTLITAYGSLQDALKKIEPLCVSEKAKEGYRQLRLLSELLAKKEYVDKIRLDFSVVNDMNYYDDIVFKGFVSGIGEGVLSGGRYDKLMSRMGKKSGGIGFAVSLDLLEGFGVEKKTADVDVLVLYDEETDLKRLAEEVETLVKAGKTVRAQKTEGKLRYLEKTDLRGGLK